MGINVGSNIRSYIGSGADVSIACTGVGEVEVGSSDASFVGHGVSFKVGSIVGSCTWYCEGSDDGFAVGIIDGWDDGAEESCIEGDIVKNSMVVFVPAASKHMRRSR